MDFSEPPEGPGPSGNGLPNDRVSNSITIYDIEAGPSPFLVKRRRVDEPAINQPQCIECQSTVAIEVPTFSEEEFSEDGEGDNSRQDVAGQLDVRVRENLSSAAIPVSGFEDQGNAEDSARVTNENSTERTTNSGILIQVPVPLPVQSPVTPGPSSRMSTFNISGRINELGWQETRPALNQRAGFLLNNSRMSDVRFLVGESKSEIYAHKTILALGSPVFEAQFYGAVGSGAVDVIELPDMDYDIFLMFLKYLYTDELDEMDDVQLLCLLRPAKKYIVPHLVDKCSDILMTELRPENIFPILNIANFYNLKKLEGACERYIDRNCAAICGSEEFINLGKPVLTEFLKRDGLNINEETLFQAVLRWASAECLRNSIEANFDNLRMVLGDCLKLIRFPTMTKEEFASVFETTSILTPGEACSVFVYMCKSSANEPSSNLVFPTLKRTFYPQLCIINRFGGEPVEHSLNYRSGEIYNYRINFKVDRQIFLKGVNIFSIRCGPQVVYGNRREFSGALYLYEKGTSQNEGRKQFNKVGSLELEGADSDNSPVLGRRNYYPVLFDSEIKIAAAKSYTLCVVVSVNSHTYPSPALQTYVGVNELLTSSVMYSEDLAINFTFSGLSTDGSVGRFTAAQIPELVFCL